MVRLQEKLKLLPPKPGVYLFKNDKGEVLYVGKAKNLRSRVRTYFQKNQNYEPRIGLLISEIADLDYVIVSSETESLILENNFIKQYRPKYNVRLRDDKNYQFIKIDYESEIPQVYSTRRISPPRDPFGNTQGHLEPRRTGEEGSGEVVVGHRAKLTMTPSTSPSRGGGHLSKYFGPYTSGLTVKQTLKLLRRIFSLCGNKKISRRPCFYYHLGRCPGVCIGKIPVKEYRKTFRQVEKFLGNRQSEVVANLKKEMKAAASKKQFEQAARFRDALLALRRIWEKQKVVFTRPVSEDYLSLYQAAGSEAIVNLFMVREGRLIHHEIFELKTPPAAESNFALQSFIKQYYADASDIPKTIVTPFALPELKSQVAKRGKRFQLLKLGYENAQDYYQRNEASFEKVLAELRRILDLPKIPKRIEAYDISNIQGFLPVGSMIVFENGQPKKSDYRKFKINSKQTPDDVAMMREIISRRFSRHIILPLMRGRRRGGRSEQLITMTFPSPPHLFDGAQGDPEYYRMGHEEGTTLWPLPDLIVIDGGRGQLNAALEVLHIQYSIFNIPIIGLAKRLEEIYLPGKKQPLRLPEDSPALYLLQRIRDEAHRFAITFYRGRHRKELTRTKLSEIPGIGPKTRKKLLRHFGSVSVIRSASAESLAQIIGLAAAKKVKENL